MPLNKTSDTAMRLYFFFQSLLLAFLLFACESKVEKSPLPAVEVTQYVVEPKTLPMVYDYVGFAQSSHAVEIRARVEGYLDTIAYQEGQLVKEGELLFQLDPKQYQARVEQSKGDVAKQEALLENAKLTVRRLEPLYKQEAASKKDLDNAIADKLSTEAALQTAKAQLLDNEINLGYTTILSPITGYADRSNYREGALMTPGNNNLLTTLSVLDPIWVYFNVSDYDILRIRQMQNKQAINVPQVGMTTLPQNNGYVVEGLRSDGSVYPYKGKLDFGSPTYDQSTGTLLMRAVFSNPQAEIRPGEFMRIKIHGIERPNAIFVPRRALMQKKEGMFVYLIDKQGKAAAQDVAVGDWYGEYQIITNGLEPGDKVIVDGINKVFPGMPVHVAENWASAQSSSKIPSSKE
ncbi:efflux RND transporter periplasmic adaptor subunit [Parachlamydia sp. AcF125]|uniref:efflux RND transporter periplasmic adaptor subunit n=1 Tax=Parachlamydia sp. AcF125 TaxID=2795736 RepID=UPI001BD90143|nr:efflux RND transporter periplasmic adaptor subunit [Parachlamydia sp. AcF125]MBS4168947.1 Multidrug export protein AcrE [Parachlamydia sp. AcF125]